MAIISPTRTQPPSSRHVSTAIAKYSHHAAAATTTTTPPRHTPRISPRPHHPPSVASPQSLSAHPCALSGVAGGYLGGRTDLNAAGRLTLNTYADLGADLLAQGAGTALGGGPLDLERAVFAAAFGTGVRAVHLGGASAAAAVRARAAAATLREFGGADGGLR